MADSCSNFNIVAPRIVKTINSHSHPDMISISHLLGLLPMQDKDKELLEKWRKKSATQYAKD